MAYDQNDYYKRHDAAKKQAKAVAKAAADAAVKGLASVGRHLSKDDLDEVRETEYDKVFREEMDAFEMDESNARYEAMMAKEREDEDGFPCRRNVVTEEDCMDMAMGDDAGFCYDDVDSNGEDCPIVNINECVDDADGWWDESMDDDVCDGQR